MSVYSVAQFISEIKQWPSGSNSSLVEFLCNYETKSKKLVCQDHEWMECGHTKLLHEFLDAWKAVHKPMRDEQPLEAVRQFLMPSNPLDSLSSACRERTLLFLTVLECIQRGLAQSVPSTWRPVVSLVTWEDLDLVAFELDTLEFGLAQDLDKSRRQTARDKSAMPFRLWLVRECAQNMWWTTDELKKSPRVLQAFAFEWFVEAGLDFAHLLPSRVIDMLADMWFFAHSESMDVGELLDTICKHAKFMDAVLNRLKQTLESTKNKTCWPAWISLKHDRPDARIDFLTDQLCETRILAWTPATPKPWFVLDHILRPLWFFLTRRSFWSSRSMSNAQLVHLLPFWILEALDKSVCGWLREKRRPSAEEQKRVRAAASRERDIGLLLRQRHDLLDQASAVCATSASLATSARLDRVEFLARVWFPRQLQISLAAMAK